MNNEVITLINNADFYKSIFLALVGLIILFDLVYFISPKVFKSIRILS